MCRAFIWAAKLEKHGVEWKEQESGLSQDQAATAQTEEAASGEASLDHKASKIVGFWSKLRMTRSWSRASFRALPEEAQSHSGALEKRITSKQDELAAKHDEVLQVVKALELKQDGPLPAGVQKALTAMEEKLTIKQDQLAAKLSAKHDEAVRELADKHDEALRMLRRLVDTCELRQHVQQSDPVMQERPAREGTYERDESYNRRVIDSAVGDHHVAADSLTSHYDTATGCSKYLATIPRHGGST
eukprot:gnl/TRDRNA2_/TRDRNA2_166159_c0_seq1.p1 gnl/TRDRNA2_/TRDRNA2_166159_c0~~gnl/TRDRNA2_/TRDRNA2_166159_c0_seq1.p1  ORF type:complete len:245 (-),score=52.05 gnl/TRDRNA2_/TRDRNA2_166159_c0_seq1:60-794(-)